MLPDAEAGGERVQEKLVLLSQGLPPPHRRHLEISSSLRQLSYMVSHASLEQSVGTMTKGDLNSKKMISQLPN